MPAVAKAPPSTPEPSPWQGSKTYYIPVHIFFEYSLVLSTTIPLSDASYDALMSNEHAPMDEIMAALEQETGSPEALPASRCLAEHKYHHEQLVSRFYAVNMCPCKCHQNDVAKQSPAIILDMAREEGKLRDVHDLWKKAVSEGMGVQQHAQLLTKEARTTQSGRTVTGFVRGMAKSLGIGRRMRRQKSKDSLML